jgi:hypothetical protein
MLADSLSIRLYAERRAGELLKDLEKAVGNQHTKSASFHDGKKQTKSEQKPSPAWGKFLKGKACRVSRRLEETG